MSEERTITVPEGPPKLEAIPYRVLYPMNEACVLLGGIDRTTFHNWYTRGLFKVKRQGRRTFLPHTELERYARTNLTGFHARQDVAD